MAKNGKNGKKKYGNGDGRAYEDHYARRALVRLMWLRGMQCHDIVDYLKKPTTPDGKPKTRYLLNHTDPAQTVRQDMVAIRLAEKAVVEEEQPHALAVYIGQQKELFRLALMDKAWASAVKSSMNIARAQGIPVDEVIHVIGDVEHSHRVEWVNELSVEERKFLAKEVKNRIRAEGVN